MRLKHAAAHGNNYQAGFPKNRHPAFHMHKYRNTAGSKCDRNGGTGWAKVA